MGKVLIVDDDRQLRQALLQTLELAGVQAQGAGSFIEAKDFIKDDFDGIVLSDLRMPGRDGFHLLSYSQKIDPELPVILLTGHAEIPLAVKAMGQGAFDFLEKPCARDALLPVLERALKTRSLVLENRNLRSTLEASDPAARMVFGISDKAQNLRRAIRTVAALNTDVLISGAPGTGVSKVAEIIHMCSPRAQGPFQKRAADGLEGRALEQALEDCARGILFLDRIDLMPQDMQLALLNLLEHHTQVRLIAGMTVASPALVAPGSVQEDLFYRLTVASVHIPSLSERTEDIPVMFSQYVQQAAEQSGLAAPAITPQVTAHLLQQDISGNARALMSMAMQFVLGIEETTSKNSAAQGLVAQMAQVEKTLLIDALRHSKGHAVAAAESLQLPRKTFYDKLAKYGIRAETFRL